MLTTIAIWTVVSILAIVATISDRRMVARANHVDRIWQLNNDRARFNGGIGTNTSNTPSMPLHARLKREPWYMISACKGTALDAENTRKMSSELLDLGVEFYPVHGVWNNTREISFLVFSSKTIRPIMMAEQYGQEAILFNHGLHTIKDHSLDRIDSLDIVDEAPVRGGYTLLPTGAYMVATLRSDVTATV